MILPSVAKTNMTLKWHIQPHVPISSYAHMTQLSVYIPHVDPLQSTMTPGTLIYIHFTL